MLSSCRDKKEREKKSNNINRKKKNMQSGYGGVSEIPQFMVDASLFSISTASPADIHTTPSQPHKFLHQHPHHPHQQHHHHQSPQPPLQDQQQQHHHHHHHPHHHSLQPRFPHFNSIPITQQLFHQNHQFQLFQQQQQQEQEQRRIQQHHHHHNQHHQQLGLDRESAPENSNSPSRMMSAGGGNPSFLAAAMNFKLAVNESSGGGSRDGLNDEEGILQGDDGSESRIHPWQREEESSIKEPFWRPLDIDYINRNNKRCKDKQMETPNSKCYKKSKEGSENDHGNNSSSNYKLFSELEAIYKPGVSMENNQTGSGSALTGENPLLTTAAPEPTSDDHVGVVDHVSDTSIGEEAPVIKKFQKSSNGRNKRKRKQQLSSIAAFFEGLVKQLMDHQEGLHRKFLEVMERRDQERTSREEAWRQQEAAKSSREAAAKAQEQALASTREAAIITFLEKITGESLNLPSKSQFESQLPGESRKNDDNSNKKLMETSEALNINNADSNNNIQIQLNSSRWPKAEVQALIGVRSTLECKFQEPGLKGPLWEEVSSSMASMGYFRSSKRCKEKWENINKYFRKTKDSAKKRPQHSKTCPYFHQLDQLYSKSFNKPPPLISGPNAEEERKDNSELLDAIVVSTDQANFKIPEMGSLCLDFNAKGGENSEAGSSAIAGKGLLELRGQGVGNAENNEDDDDEGDDEEGGDEEEGDGEEGEGESQEHLQDQEGIQREHQYYHHNKVKEHPQHDSPFFFGRLQT